MLLLLLEVLFAVVLLGGVAVIYWPVALMLGGVLGIVACERAATVRSLRGGSR